MTNATTLTFTRTLAARPHAVWRCWTEPDLIKQWFAPRPVQTTVVEIDVRPGGGFRTVMVIPDHGEMAGDAGCILVAKEDQRLVWTNALGPDYRPNVMGDGPMDFAFTAEILIAPTAGGCTYTATVQHATDAAAKAHKDMGFFDGWGTAATQLEEVAAAL